jgi:beta-phosphoglucomutase-like phosphatase (HAD superfamily)
MDMNWKRDWTAANASNDDGDDVDRRAVIDAFWRAWEQRLNDLCATVEACPGASELVEGLRALRLPMAIATSSRMDSVCKKKLR